MNEKYNKLQDCACAALRQSSRLISKYYEAQLKEQGVTSAQFNILAVLINIGPIPVSHLAAQLGQDRTGLTRNLAIMEKNGWVNLHPGEDRRVKIVSLTPKGTQKLDSAIPLWENAQARIQKEFGDLTQIHKLSSKLKTLIEV